MGEYGARMVRGMNKEIDFVFLSVLRALENKEVSVLVRDHLFPIHGEIVRVTPTVMILLQDKRWVVINTRYLIVVWTEEDVPRFTDWFGVIT